MKYRVVDYQSADTGDWLNTDEGDPPPTERDLEETPELSVGWEDEDGNWHYRWIEGFFEADYEDWTIEDAIYETALSYGITIAA